MVEAPVTPGPAEGLSGLDPAAEGVQPVAMAGAAGFQTHGFPPGAERLVSAAEPLEHRAQTRMGLGVVRLDPYGFAVGRSALDVLSLHLALPISHGLAVGVCVI